MPDQPNLEVQLGHLCNNRCVFCISGHRTSLGKAPLLPAEPILEALRRARAQGRRSLTLLGGEPTLQPIFYEVLEEAVTLGFAPIVIFTNGSQLHRPEVLERILATGGTFELRFSFQGATREAHERTTLRRGSFTELVEALRLARERGQRTTVNMCVVRQNYQSVEHFPALLEPQGVSQLHLDMMHPYDFPPEKTLEDLREIIPRYSDLAEPLERMFRGFSPDFDVRVGNLPYCLLPHRADRIHHGGQPTLTATADIEGLAQLNEAWDKYRQKQARKVKPEGCASCVFTTRCTGVFQAYAEIHGTDELTPVTEERLGELDPGRRWFSLHCRDELERLLGRQLPDGFAQVALHEPDLGELHVSFAEPSGAQVSFAVRPAGRGVASTHRSSLHLLDGAANAEPARRALGALWQALLAMGEEPVHPPGDDAFVAASPRIAPLIARLRAAAPFPGLTWSSTVLRHGGSRAELGFEGPEGLQVVLWFQEEGGRRRGGYRLGNTGPVPEAVTVGVEALLRAVGQERDLPAAAPRRVADA